MAKMAQSSERVTFLSTTQFGFGRAYQLVHDFPIRNCCCYPPFVEMLYKQFKVLLSSLSNTVEQIRPVNGLTRLVPLVRPVRVVKQLFTSRTIG